MILNFLTHTEVEIISISYKLLDSTMIPRGKQIIIRSLANEYDHETSLTVRANQYGIKYINIRAKSLTTSKDKTLNLINELNRVLL